MTLFAVTLGGQAFGQGADFLVDADAVPGGNGNPLLGWSNAAHSLEDVMALAVSDPSINDAIILVANGVYSPDLSASNLDTLVPGGTAANPRHHSFVVREPMKIYGGYRGYDPAGSGTTDVDNPDGSGFNTILEGDVGVPIVDSDNLLHVMYIDGSIATGSPFLTSEVVLRNLHIRGGRATDGSASMGGQGEDGGGIYIHDGVLSIDRHIWIDDNEANRNGGGICTSDAALRMGRGRIKHNTAINHGGGIYLDNTPEPPVGSTAWRRLSHLFNLDLRDNEAGQRGGGIYLAASHPGAKVSGIGHPGFVFANNLVLYNKARLGGGIYLQLDENESIWDNNTIVDNESTITGGGFYAEADALFLIANSILYFNTGFLGDDNMAYPATNTSIGVFPPDNSFQKMRHNDIGESQQVGALNGGFVWCNLPSYMNTNFDFDPGFQNQAAGNYRLTQQSVCLDMGDDNLLPFDYMDIDDQGAGTELQVLPLDIGRLLNGTLTSWRENQIPGAAPGLPSTLPCGPVGLMGLDAPATSLPFTGGRVGSICDLGCYENTWVIVPGQ